MTQLTWVDPVPDPLQTISPSTLSAFRRCPLKLAFQRDPTTRGLRKPSPRAALGIVAHGVHEIAATGDPAPGQTRRAWLDEQWETLLAGQVRRIAAAWPGRDVPPVTQWDGLVATRVRTLRRLGPTSGRTPVPMGPAGVHAFPWIERNLEDPQTRISGTPDRVEVRDGKLRVVDLKSGVHQTGIQEDQKRQLLLYAHLVDVAIGRLPEVGIVEDATGKEYEIEIESVAVSAAVQDAQSAIASFNESVSRKEVMAKASQAACRFCPFRTVCVSYWDSEGKSDWDVRGIVAGEPDARSFNVDTGGDRIVRIVRAAGSTVPKSEDEVLVLDLERAGPDTLRMRWNSEIRLPRPSTDKVV